MAGTKAVLLDAGPWVAYLVAADQHHDWARRVFERFPSFVTCEAVVAEVCARLAYFGEDPDLAPEFLSNRAVRLEFNLQQHVAEVSALMKKYRDQRMDLADACLVKMSELTPECQVVTTDSDFNTYRRFGRQTVPTIQPQAR